MIWYLDASSDYDPSTHISEVRAPVLHSIPAVWGDYLRDFLAALPDR